MQLWSTEEHSCPCPRGSFRPFYRFFGYFAGTELRKPHGLNQARVGLMGASQLHPPLPVTSTYLSLHLLCHGGVFIAAVLLGKGTLPLQTCPSEPQSNYLCPFLLPFCPHLVLPPYLPSPFPILLPAPEGLPRSASMQEGSGLPTGKPAVCADLQHFMAALQQPELAKSAFVPCLRLQYEFCFDVLYIAEILMSYNAKWLQASNHHLLNRLISQL